MQNMVVQLFATVIAGWAAMFGAILIADFFRSVVES